MSDSIYCESQAECDEALRSGNLPVLVGDGHFTIGGTSYVEARDSSYVVAWDSSYVLARDSSRVVARNSSYVLARDSSRVEAWDASYVTAWDTSYVIARDSSRVVGHDSSSIEAWGSGEVKAWDSSYIVARRVCKKPAQAGQGNLCTFAYGLLRRIVLIRRCAWCGRLRGFRLTRSGGTSHTICRKCVHKFVA
jgi:hypothetical protein